MTEEPTEEERELRRLRAAIGSISADWPKGKITPLPKEILERIEKYKDKL